MAIWYEGNLNKSENRHEENGAVYYVRGVRESEGRRYERYAVATHFIERGEDFVEVMRRYVSPLYQEGDVVTLSEKVVSMCQNNTVEMKDVKVGFWAKFLSRFATHNQNGIAMDEPYKLQLAIDMKGLPLILWACFRTLIGKFTGHRGVFYEIVGQDVAGIDGVYSPPPLATHQFYYLLSPQLPPLMSLHCAAETYIKIKVPGADGAEGKAMSFMYFLAVLIGPLVKILYSFIGNYAATMIVATLILKLLLFPLSIHQQKSTAKMSVFQPLITEIQQKYKNDPQKQQEELMKLQQEHGYNPMGGCMPMLLTMLVLFGFLGVVYYPVHYIFGVSNDAVKAACEAIGLATTNTSTMQTALIQAIHNGASIDPSIISASVVAEIQNFNTSFFGMDMCDVPGFHLTPIAIFPAIATVTMFVSYFITQKLSGMDAQMQGSMKVMMLVMNLMFVTFCFNAPVGFSLYYGVSNVVQIFQSYVTYKIYSPEKFKAQYEAELAAKRAEKKKKRTVTVEQNGKQVEKEVTLGEANKLRLEMARQREAELYKDERTTPLNKD